MKEKIKRLEGRIADFAKLPPEFGVVMAAVVPRGEPIAEAFGIAAAIDGVAAAFAKAE
ncbi:hypothetical protein [Paraburkholderia sp. HD33-4]|uniref:hypothetical protein n=1 Tax=Paraburkholderia sp. HD33-4 TaxID=2883242 RepID=UPI001F3CD0DE|nr:hypothetical protein [Paraburkholderia sp. HD33-4]